MLHPADRALSKTLSFLFLELYLSAAYAEVMDKLPSLAYIWGVAIACGIICGVLTYFRRWLFILVVLPLMWFASLFTEIHSGDMGPAIFAEAGGSYINQTYLATFTLIVFTTLGWMLNARKRS